MILTLNLLHASGHPSAVIAGGAIRDMYHERMVSDVDIYIHHPAYIGKPATSEIPLHHPMNSSMWLDYWSDVLKLRPSATRSQILRDNVKMHFSQYDDPGKPDEEQDIVAVWNVFKGFNLYQIIFTAIEPIEYINNQFDFGICKAYCDGSKVHYTGDFMRDSRNKTITFVGKGMSVARIKRCMTEHLPRIQEKYPGYNVVIPETLKAALDPW
jgi:hypothetical protein